MRFVFILLVFTAITLSCKKTKRNNCEGPELNCSAMLCIAHWDNFHFKLVDKITGNDLVFGANPRYTSADIKIFFDAARIYPMNLFTDNAKKEFLAMTAKQEMYLVIKGTDVYKLTAEFRGESCCSSIVKNLWLDGQLVCTCCSDVIQLAVN
jgi:hypothetical protein